MLEILFIIGRSSIDSPQDLNINIVARRVV